MVVRLTHGTDDVFSIVVEPARSRPRIVEGPVEVRTEAGR